MAIVLISGCTTDFREGIVITDVERTDLEIEELDNDYGGKIITVQLKEVETGRIGEIFDISYTVDGRNFRNYFDARLRPALDWINENTAENSIFFNWWDYGHMIRGYTARDTIIYSPSDDMLNTLASGQWDEETGGDFSPREKTGDMVLAFLSEDEEMSKAIAERYETDYILVTELDRRILLFFFEKLEMQKYVRDGQATKEADELALFKLLDDDSDLFEGVYSDEFVKIYKIMS